MTWKDIKLATLQKMFAAEGANIPNDDAAEEYVAGMPQVANEALQILSTAGKYIVKKIEIAHTPLPNVIAENIANKIHTVIDDEMDFEGEGARAYYFEFLGKGTLEVYVNGALVDTVALVSTTHFTPYRGVISNADKEKVVIKIKTAYSASIKNIALYKVLFDSADEVQTYGEKIKYDLKKIADDFYCMSSSEIYYEGENPRYVRTNDYYQEANNILVLDRNMPGNYTIYYNAYPTQITHETLDEYELPLDPEVAVLLPLYMASQLYKDDDAGIATTYRNEFEVARELLIGTTPSPSAETFVSESGWW